MVSRSTCIHIEHRKTSHMTCLTKLEENLSSLYQFIHYPDPKHVAKSQTCSLSFSSMSNLKIKKNNYQKAKQLPKSQVYRSNRWLQPITPPEKKQSDLVHRVPLWCYDLGLPKLKCNAPVFIDRYLSCSVSHSNMTSSTTDTFIAQQK